MLFRAAFAAAALLLAAAPAASEPLADPLRFFEGRTEGDGTTKVLFKKSYRTRSVGHGRIERDGSLVLVQRVQDDGKPVYERRWHMRETSPGHFTGTMSEAVGPVTVEREGNRFRFRFKMKGNLSVEQWLAPLPGNRAASSSTRVKRFGITVATSEGTIRNTGE